MKQLLLIIMLLFTSVYLHANSASEEGRALRKEIRKKILYPEFAKENQLRGIVRVHFVVDQTGRIEVKEINASHDSLADYVIEELEKIEVIDRRDFGDHYANFRFRFVEM